ncbi:hypothetical protein TCAL_02057 [Tigriopus californicus]|uniref:Uncharacterized protein n=2 Tax=Tigriopus californicus TaxID=6832 RepID=A0A553NB46_TIGCA|nr:hypothetical protein TCAL_02057 [Tigriopus californicus]
MVQVLQEEGQSLQNRDNQRAAATKIQTWWRGIFQHKRWLSIRKGFTNLQNLYRKRLLTKERFMRERLQNSELQFQGMYEEIVQNRMKAERQFQDLLEAKQEPRQFQKKPTRYPQQDLTTSRQDDFQWTTRQEMAAIKIQIAIRKWLRKQRKRPIWLQSLMIPSTLTEDRIRRYQDEIELWQQNHQVPPMDPTELQELHHRAQLEFMSFNRRALESKRAEHMIMSKMAQSKTILSILETAPALDDYKPDNRTDFMSLPLPIAVKARLEHKAAMARLTMPRWQRILHDSDNGQVSK